MSFAYVFCSVVVVGVFGGIRRPILSLLYKAPTLLSFFISCYTKSHGREIQRYENQKRGLLP